VAVQCTSVEPSANVLPEAWSQEIDGEGSALSVAVTEYVTAAPLGPVASTTGAGNGWVNVGATSSIRFTVTLKEAEAEFPDESCALQFTTVVPSGNVSPE
jgi:hypothetical protein